MATAKGPQLDRNNGSKNNLFKVESDDLADLDEEEYMIAADLTLYSNPLNRALGRVAESPKSKRKSSKEKAGKKVSVEERETIAADLTKYDSPMSELDHMHAAKQEEQKLKNIRKTSKSSS